ncbi:hypothetical protein ACHAWF_018527 [Thalassiosira exigua]
MTNPIKRRNKDDTAHQVEALGSFDHGLEPHDVGYDTEETKVESVQQFLTRTFDVTCNALSNGLKRLRESEYFSDPRLRDSHTEEIVAGERMAVSYVIRKESFEAPC